MTEYEILVKKQEDIYKTILNLELGLKSEEKKIIEFEFYKDNQEFDIEAINLQIVRSKENIKQITQILKIEKDKLKFIEEELKSANQILNSHGAKICLLGTIPHTWQILSKYPSGNFRHRKCTICQTEEKIGYT